MVEEREFEDHAAALAWARDTDEVDDEVQRVEFLGQEQDCWWVGALEGRDGATTIDAIPTAPARCAQA